MTTTEFIVREYNVQKAAEKYPGMEMGAAFEKYMTEQGKKITYISTDDKTIQNSMREAVEKLKRPCRQEGCPGVEHLEGICNSCIEGRKGYRSKWICDECLHRELSKKEVLEWLVELSS